MGSHKRGFARTFVLPALCLFVIPAVSCWFYGHATRVYDQRFREAVLAQVEQSRELDREQRDAARRHYEATPGSRICANPDPELQRELEVCSDYRQFAWLRSGALAALLLGAAALALALTCSALAFVSRRAQYVSFLLGWNVLRAASSLQVVLQGLLALSLSYWMTAVWLREYVPKLILIVGALAVIAIIKVVKAIFARVDEPLSVCGEIVRESDAPELWAHVKNTCAALGTAPPQHIIAGIDDNFFVTEGRVSVGGQRLEGRTLFISLSLLKILENHEANAVLAHEMAHFSGGDTQFSKQLSPLLARYAVYLRALAEGGLTLPVYYFMLCYRALFELSLGRTSRQREHRADRVAAEVTSAEHVARALLKVGAYSSYRARVEEQLFTENRAHASVRIPVLVAQGFSSYSKTRDLLEDLHDKHFPHPFDTHPSLAARLGSLDVRVGENDYGEWLTQPVASSWFSAIRGAEDLETRQWQAYEREFAEVHERALAYRFEPASDEERAHVLRYFPEQTFASKSGGEARLTYDGLALPNAASTLAFDDIASCAVKEHWFKKYLDIKLVPARGRKKYSIRLGDFAVGGDAFLEAFQRYYGRHLAMRQHRSSR